MKRKNTTRNALFTSIISLLLCVSMLVGTTFAWFTDEVKSGVNTITAGNLDLEVYYAYPSDVVDGDIPADAWRKVEADKSLFNQDALWEPGYTEVVFFKFDNAGSLAFQYQMNIDILNEVYGKTKDGADIQLSKYINTYICNNFQWNYKQFLFTDRNSATNPDGAPDPYFDTLYNAANAAVNRADNYTESELSLDHWQWLDPSEATYATLVLWMPTDVGNEANHNGVNIPSIDLGINVVATQYNWQNEKDSFDQDYDKNAKFPDVPVTVTNKPANEKASVKDSDEQVMVDIPAAAPDGEYKLEVGTKTYSTDANGNTTVSMDITLLKDGEKVTAADGIEYDVSVNIGAGLSELVLKHKDEVITNYAYNPTSGIVTFKISHFSPFTFTYKEDAFVAVTATAGYETLQAAIDAAQNGDTITLLKDITEDVTVTQKADVKITINGNNKNFAGVIVVDGKSATLTTAGLTIKNLNFKADEISADACIRLGDGTNATRYTCNVTVENCTFDVPGAVGVKSYTGGDKNVTITSCTATANCHSLCQLKGVDGVLVEKCNVNSKNGMNFNNSDNVVVDNCVTDVKGYAVRFGESSGGSGAAETYTIKNSTLKAACEDGDSVVILRGTADNATLNLEDTTLEGTSKIANTATNAKVLVNGNEFVADGLAKNGVNYYVSNANGLETLNAMIADGTITRGYTINLTADIDFAGKTWKMVDSHVDFKNYVTEINGNGHTLSNLTINDQAMFRRFAGSGNVTIKDITFDKANVTSNNLNTSILTVQTYQNVLLDNVDVTNSTITGAYKVAPLIASVYNESSSTITATLKNCDVSNTTVTGTSYDFMITGMVAFVHENNNDQIVFENCTVSNVTLKSNSTGYNAMAAVYCNDGSVEGSFDNVDGVTVTNVTKN